ncbi:MAG: helix-turn-helix transcriptional regulator, partial [Acetobacteraceae bacterium]
GGLGWVLSPESAPFFSLQRDNYHWTVQTSDTLLPDHRCFGGVRGPEALFDCFSKENKDHTMDDPASTSSPALDWHPADVLAALKKRGQTLAGLSVAHGYHPTAAGKALKRSWPALQALIAREIGVQPQTIWPSRYDARGTSLRAPR